MKTFKNALVLLIIIKFCATLSAGSAHCLNLASEADIYSFAENLFIGSDYYRAITEYKRLLFYFPNGNFSDDARFKIAKSYQLGGKFEISRDLFSDLAGQFTGKDLGSLCEFEAVESIFRSSNYESAAISYEKFLEEDRLAKFKDLASYRLGLSELHMRKPDDAISKFSSVNQGSKIFALSSEMADKTKEFKNLSRKSPALAGIMSAIIPGTGQFYNGRIRDGIIALITNGLFIWGSYEAYRRDYYSIGIITSVFALGWYSGNVYGAVNGAHRYNYLKEEAFFSKLNDKYEDISPAQYSQ